MFIVTAKLSKKRAALVIAAAAVLLAAVLLIFTSGKSRAEPTSAAGSSVEVSYKKIKDNAARITFLNAFGWEVAENPISIEDVVIPEKFEDTYEKYNELQKSQGLDLEKYQGKTVRRYTYRVTNYGETEGAVYANLLIYKNRIVGGDICSAEYQGFMHGFERP